jgi:hypothetical protein
MNVFLSTSIVTTFEPTVASSYIYKITAFTPGLSGKFLLIVIKIALGNLRFLFQIDAQSPEKQIPWPWSVLSNRTPLQIFPNTFMLISPLTAYKFALLVAGQQIRLEDITLR